MTNARRGLRRIGQRAWMVEGPNGRYIIEREGRKRWTVKADHIPRDFYCERCRSLSAARTIAEGFAGAFPYFLDRRVA